MSYAEERLFSPYPPGAKNRPTPKVAVLFLERLSPQPNEPTSRNHCSKRLTGQNSSGTHLTQQISFPPVQSKERQIEPRRGGGTANERPLEHSLSTTSQYATPFLRASPARALRPFREWDLSPGSAIPRAHPVRGEARSNLEGWFINGTFARTG